MAQGTGLRAQGVGGVRGAGADAGSRCSRYRGSREHVPQVQGQQGACAGEGGPRRPCHNPEHRFLSGILLASGVVWGMGYGVWPLASGVVWGMAFLPLKWCGVWGMGYGVWPFNL